MSAAISTPPSATAPAAQTALNSSGTAGMSDGAIADAETGSIGSFAALFQKLAGKQLSANADAAQVSVPAEAAQTTDTSTASTKADDTLAALFPFLEAMGFTQEETNGTNSANEEIPVETVTDASLLAGIAPALTPQLASTPAISAAQPGSGNTVLAQPSLTDAQAGLEMQPAIAAEVAADDLQGSKSGGGGEFASRFAAALEAAGTSSATNPAGVTQQPSGSPAPQAPSPSVPALPVDQAVGASGWGQEVGNRIVWMANRMESRAELVLTPPQMGRVEVSLSISGDQASASFVSNNPAVREALEAALPRLREVLSEAGIQLGQAQVGAENANQSAQQEKNGDNFGSNRNTHLAAGPLQTLPAESSASAGLKIGRGLVDVFA